MNTTANFDAVTTNLERIGNIALNRENQSLSKTDSGIGNINIYIGYDSKEPIATYVCMHSLQKHARKILPISILRIDKLDDILLRERAATQSTEFAFSRFLVPFLSNYRGFSIFLDSDFLFTADICDLVDKIDPSKAVSVVKHDYEPKTESKFLNQKQTKYERKNWSSFMIFNNERCRSLTPEVVSESTGLYLHRFQWLDDQEIGEIDLSWNYLVGEYPATGLHEINALHYTIGGPYFDDFRDSDFSECWFKEYSEMNAPLK